MKRGGRESGGDVKPSGGTGSEQPLGQSVPEGQDAVALAPAAPKVHTHMPCPGCVAMSEEWVEKDDRIRALEAEVERLETENNTLKINILEAGLTPPGWVRLAGVERESDEEARR